MTLYVVRCNETYEPLEMFPAPDTLAAGLLLRKKYPTNGRQVHLISTAAWPQERKERILLEILQNCVTTQLAKLPD